MSESIINNLINRVEDALSYCVDGTDSNGGCTSVIVDLKMALKRAGAQSVDFKFIQNDNSFCVIARYLVDGDYYTLPEIKPHREPTPEEIEDITSRYLQIQEVECIISKHLDGETTQYRIRWEHLTTFKKYYFTGPMHSPLAGQTDMQLSYSHVANSSKADNSYPALRIKEMCGILIAEGHSSVWKNNNGLYQGYDELSLKSLLKKEGYELMGVNIHRQVIASTTYLFADAIAYKNNEYNGEHDYYIYSLPPRYSVSDELLNKLDGQLASDIDVRFSFKPIPLNYPGIEYYPPVWTVATIGETSVRLSGDRIDWDKDGMHY